MNILIVLYLNLSNYFCNKLENNKNKEIVKINTKVVERENVQSMDFTLNECVNLCLFHRAVLLEKLQKVVLCLDPSLRNSEYSIESIQQVFDKQIGPILNSLEKYLTSPEEGLKSFMEMFETDEKEDNYEYNKEHLERKKKLEIENKDNEEPQEEVYVEKYYKVKPVLKEMNAREMENWEDLNRRGQIVERIDLLKDQHSIPVKVVMRFLMNYARTVGRRYFPQEVKVLSVQNCLEYISGKYLAFFRFFEFADFVIKKVY